MASVSDVVRVNLSGITGNPVTTVLGLGPLLIGVGNILTALSNKQSPSMNDIVFVCSGLIGLFQGGTK